MDDLISRKELRKAFKESGYFTNAWLHWARLLIDQAPTVLHDNYSMGYQDGVKKVLSENQKIYSDMKLIKDAINDPNKNGFDICRLIKSITDEYYF